MDRQTASAQRIIEVGIDDYLEVWIDNFLQARRAENLAPGSIRFYKQKLALFAGFADSQLINRIGQINPTVIRDFIGWLESSSHNPGGQHAAYRSLKVFLRWYWEEVEPDYRNPIDRTKAPRVPEKILPPVSLEDITRMLDAINTKTFTGIRDKALLLTALDTGARASEILALDLEDFDGAGELHIQKGKGGKGRIVFVSEKTRRAIRAYLRRRNNNCPALFINIYQERLKYNGLRAILFRIAKRAGLKEFPTAHQFRRAFALETLRAGGDLYTLQKQMGHADLSVLRHYLKLTNEDVRAAHASTSPVDRLK